MGTLFSFKKYKSLTKPHGNEWKKEFISIINPFLDEKYFPKGNFESPKKFHVKS